jgi:dephospho-CoA kinase
VPDPNGGPRTPADDDRSTPIVIGLTGNIGSGKSLVGQILVRLGARHTDTGEQHSDVVHSNVVHSDVVHSDVIHIDADRLSRQVMAPDTDVWHQVVAAFGDEIVAPDGSLDRARLGAIVFGEARALARLEAIVHPAVIALTEQQIADARGARAAVIEAIKLIESGMVRRLCDVLWVVTAPREVRLERLVSQRGMDRATARQRIDAQPPEADKVAQADVVIDNSGTIEETTRQVERAWAQLRAQETGFFCAGRQG